MWFFALAQTWSGNSLVVHADLIVQAINWTLPGATFGITPVTLTWYYNTVYLMTLLFSFFVVLAFYVKVFSYFWFLIVWSFFLIFLLKNEKNSIENECWDAWNLTSCRLTILIIDFNNRWLTIYSDGNYSVTSVSKDLIKRILLSKYYWIINWINI